MPMKDNKSNQRVINILDETLVANGFQFSNGIDTRDYDQGIFIMIYLANTVGTTITAGSINVNCQESDDFLEMNDNISGNQIIGSIPTISFDDDNDPSGDNQNPTVLHTFGVISSLRYLRLHLGLTGLAGTGTPGMRVIAHVTERGEYNPQ